MFLFIIMTFIFAIVIMLLSLISPDLSKKVLLPLTFVVISLIMYVFSFIIAGWEGIKIGVVSISLFVAALISLIAIVVLYVLNSKNHE